MSNIIGMNFAHQVHSKASEGKIRKNTLLSALRKNVALLLMSEVLKLFDQLLPNENGYSVETPLDHMFRQINKASPGCYAAREYNAWHSLPYRTASCVRDTLVSGMAKGIDSYAHTVCLNTGGYTVAILGNGLDICYPSEHNKLMKCIEEKGLLISEYPPGTHPDRYRFPRRNRLISSWSDKLFVIQAEKGSGALITAEYSRKYGREVEME